MIMYTKLNYHKYHNKLLYLFAVILITSIYLYFVKSQTNAQKMQTIVRNLDHKTIKILLVFPKIVNTIRIQALHNPLTLELEPIDKEFILNKNQNVNGSPLYSRSETIQIQEGEDATIQMTAIGITVKTSEGFEPSYGCSKVKLNSNGLYHIELSNIPPIILKGLLEITYNSEKNLLFINHIKISDLIICSASEISPSPEIESNKALLVAIRTKIAYLLQNNKHSTTYDLCSTSDCLPYRGFGNKRQLIEILYESMPELVMKTYDKTNSRFELFEPFYHECCGGKTSSAKDIFDKDDIVHVSVEDRVGSKSSENCFHCPSFIWFREFSNDEISDFLSNEYAGGPNRIFLQFIPSKIDKSGRICEIKLLGRKELTIPGVNFLKSVENYFGYNSIKSMKFIIESIPRYKRIKGMGKGHGVGMCLYGADGLSKKGFKYDEILKFYYKNINIVTP